MGCRHGVPWGVFTGSKSRKRRVFEIRKKPACRERPRKETGPLEIAAATVLNTGLRYNTQALFWRVRLGADILILSARSCDVDCCLR